MTYKGHFFNHFSCDQGNFFRISHRRDVPLRMNAERAVYGMIRICQHDGGGSERIRDCRRYRRGAWAVQGQPPTFRPMAGRSFDRPVGQFDRGAGCVCAGQPGDVRGSGAASAGNLARRAVGPGRHSGRDAGAALDGMAAARQRPAPGRLAVPAHPAAGGGRLAGQLAGRQCLWGAATRRRWWAVQAPDESGLWRLRMPTPACARRWPWRPSTG